MNTIEPEAISQYRGIKHDYDNAEAELERNKWFLSVLERDSISNEEEDKRRVFRELDIFGYTYIGKVRVHRYIFKLLYFLKLVKL